MNLKRRKVFSRGEFQTDLSHRILELEEVISGQEGEKYANRVDDRSLTFKMVAVDVVERANLNKDSRLLEVCCAAGQLSHELSKYIKPENIVATDGGVELIMAAKSRYASSGILFEVRNVHSMENREQFDCVVCKDSFHHFSDPVVAIKELMSQLKEGGILYVFDLCRSAKDEQIKKRESVMVSDHEAMRFLRSLNASLTPEEFTESAYKAGVQHIEVVYPFLYSQENIDQHQVEINADKIKEFELETLCVVYLLRKSSFSGKSQ